MPVIKSLKSPFTLSEKEYSYRTGTINISKVVFKVVEKLLSNNPNIVLGANNNKEKKEILKNEIIKLLDQDTYFDISGRDHFIKKVFDFIFEYGVLQKYIEDDNISDIDGTAYNEFSIKRRGIREKIEVDFYDKETFLTYCKLIAIRNGGILNENDSHSRVADLKNRLRINVSIPPRNISGPAISIRKHRRQSYTTDDLIIEKMLNNNIRNILVDYMKNDKSIIVCGKGAAGKTTLLRALINTIDEMERVLIIESDAEIYPDKKYCIEQRVKRKAEGGKEITLDMLIKDGLTMSLDTYCIGEITGKEAYDFIKASYSGHRVLGTIHADCCTEAITRLISLAYSNRAIESEETLRKMILEGLDAIVFLKQFKVIEIIEIKNKNSIVKIYEREANK